MCAVVCCGVVQNKHNKLKPMIVEFKAQRAKADDIEAEYNKKKRAYDNTVLALNSYVVLALALAHTIPSPSPFACTLMCGCDALRAVSA